MKNNKFPLLWTFLALAAVSSSSQAQGQASLIAQSMENDFSIICRKDQKITFGIHKGGAMQFRIARNIRVIPLEGNRVFISFLHGFTRADSEGSYLPAADESCEFFKQ
ncbi:hypothetical protein FHY16_000699 [Xanthomonas campestris]|uniref:hypothetical protein n=1 Tax=Xanthomonas euroxanthea TaxID=2259622 RepID=UPI0016115E1A|nr:hypothetical protein [Xanthomonas euroxanthea]MBB3777978.1 hypothetical protein [Xanthomonas euroxanthea]